MMAKSILKKFLLTLLILTMLPMSVFAADSPTVNEQIIYFENGSYITIELTKTETRALNLITGNKTYTFRNSEGTEAWRAVLTGTFSYNGSSATCTVSTCDVTITNTNWYVISKTASKSGNIARSSLTMGRRFAGITVDELDVNLKLTCDANGNLS